MSPWRWTLRGSRRVGHWPGTSELGPRRLDQTLVTAGVVPALRSYQVDSSDLAKAASDHLPVVIGIDPTQIVDDNA